MKTLMGVVLCIGVVVPCFAGVTIEDDVAASGATITQLSASVRPEAEREQWSASKGMTLKTALQAWAKKADWDLQWSAIDGDEEIDYPLPSALVFEGTFDQAAAKFVRLYKRAEMPLLIDINIEQRFVRVSIEGKK